MISNLIDTQLAQLKELIYKHNRICHPFQMIDTKTMAKLEKQFRESMLLVESQVKKEIVGELDQNLTSSTLVFQGEQCLAIGKEKWKKLITSLSERSTKG